MDQVIAHSANAAGQTQPLDVHLRNVADLSARFAAKFDAADLGRLAGRLHDMGKKDSRFQEYIRGGSPDSPPHKWAGAVLALQRKLAPVALAVAGHHGGLPDKAELKQKARQAEAGDVADDHAEPCAEVLSGAPHRPAYVTDALSVEFFTRMLFSALTDADFLDTESHFRPGRAGARAATGFDLDALYAALVESQGQLPGEGPVNQARNTVYRAVLEAAASEPGFFSLTVPTGGGKTRTAMAFALKHAVQHGLDRVIVVIPYTSIIEQAAEVYRGIFGHDAVVEHHSALDPDEQDERHRLAAENWDAPIIVTTSVQFFESLHDNRPSRCRKLHNVARSVVVLDEVQVLPEGVLKPTLAVMRELAANYCASFVFSTATQPAFRPRANFDGLEAIRELVPDARALFRDLARVQYSLPEGSEDLRSWDSVAAGMGRCRQALCVVNTKKDALKLLSKLPGQGRVHLSTNMCPAHRSAVLGWVKERLREGRSCRLVSTQLIEAGVDVDFPVVYRAFGPLDSIVQAAGRCNREGEQDTGRVVVFHPAEGGMPPGAYQRATQQTQALSRRISPESLHDPDLYSEYFRLLYNVADADERRVLDRRRRLAFRQTAEAYRLIDAPTTPVLVPWRGGQDLVEGLASAEAPTRRLLRRVQRFTVPLYPRALRQALNAGLCRELECGIHLWTGKYHDQVGLQMEGWSPDELIY